MNSFLDGVENSMLRLALAPALWRTVAGLKKSHAVRAQQVRAALLRTQAGKYTSIELRWQSEIEAVRLGLKSSPRELVFIDYGATKNKRLSIDQNQMTPTTVRRTVGQICGRASKPRFWAQLLFNLVREIKPESCIELGTCVGISTAYQAAALSLNKSGRLTSIEGAESVAELAASNFSVLGLQNIHLVRGGFRDVLPEALAELGPIDFAFIDGHHDGAATLEYFEQISASAAENAVIVLDDIRWSKPMRRAWRTIASSPTVVAHVDLWQMGICVLDGNRVAPR